MIKLAENRNAMGTALSIVVVSTLQDAMQKDHMVVALDSDLGNASGFKKISETNPGQFIECGICEQNMMGVAAGMSLLGFKPFVHSFAPFASRRCYDQIFMAGAYAHNTINIYASDPGFLSTHNGGTHTAFEDVALLRTLPNSIIIDGADAVEIEWAVRCFLNLGEGVHYLRAFRKPVRCIYDASVKFEIGRGNILKQGNEILLVCAGQLLADALDVAEAVEQEGISVEVIDPVTIKPLDEKLIIQEARGKKAVLTIENAYITGGLGSAVNDVLIRNDVFVHACNMGINEAFGQVGDLNYLQNVFHLSKSDIKENIMMLHEHY